MYNDLSKHKLDYSILALGAVLYLFFSYRSLHSSWGLFLATVSFAIFYCFWGMIHHLLLGNLHGRIVLEYFLVSVLGVVLISTLLI